MYVRAYISGNNTLQSLDNDCGVVSIVRGRSSAGSSIWNSICKDRGYQLPGRAYDGLYEFWGGAKFILTMKNNSTDSCHDSN